MPNLNKDTVTTKPLVKGLTTEEIRKKVKELTSTMEPSVILARVNNEVLSKVKDKDFKLKNEDKDVLTQAVLIESMENHLLLSMTVEEALQPFIIQFARDLVEEYDCRKPSEKALVHAVAESYSRIMSISKRLRINIPMDSYSELRILHLTQLGKELDRAHRHFAAALQTLKQLKNPPLNVKITTQAAYIAQNQQNLSSNSQINDHQ